MTQIRYRKPDSVKELENLDFEIKLKRYPSIRPQNIPKTLYKDNTTNDLTKCVINWIELNGFQAERINSMGRQIQTGRNIKWIKCSSKKGTADISATIKGRSVKIEIKCEATNDRIQSEHQKAYQMQIENAGGVYILVRNFTQFLEWYKKFIAND